MNYRARNTIATAILASAVILTSALTSGSANAASANFAVGLSAPSIQDRHTGQSSHLPVTKVSQLPNLRRLFSLPWHRPRLQPALQALEVLEAVSRQFSEAFPTWPQRRTVLQSAPRQSLENPALPRPTELNESVRFRVMFRSALVTSQIG